MKTKLLELVNEFGANLSTHEYNQYIPKLRDYLLPYILKYKDNDIEINKLFSDEFTESDIKKSTIYYVKNNENVRSVSAIDDFLIALNRFYDELIFERFPNNNLLKYRPFSSLSSDINKHQEIIKLNLKPKYTFPPINDEEYHSDFILEYIDTMKQTFKSLQVKILIKLMMLYGLNHIKLSTLSLEDFNENTNTLSVECSRNITIRIELPFSLANDICNYKHLRKDKPELDSNLLFITTTNKEITNSFCKENLNKIKMTTKKNLICN